MTDWPEGEIRALTVDSIGERYRRYRLPDVAAEAAMAGSMARYGQISPLAVCLREERPEVLDGFKRVASAKAIPAVTSLQARLLKVDEPTAKAIILGLNGIGGRMKELEEAWIVQALVREDGLSQLRVAELLQRHKSWVCRRLALLERLVEECREDLHLGLLSPTMARQLTRLPAGNQVAMVAAARREHLTAAEVRGVVDLIMACSSRSQIESILEQPRRALRQAQMESLPSWDPRLAQEVMRLEYEAHRAERQYNHVDPENRLIAATLEKKWEAALAAVEQARAKLSEERERAPTPISVPEELRHAFADAGQRLPTIWHSLSAPTRKSLLRTLIRGVNLLRRPDGTVQIRIVWPGGLVSERIVRLSVFTLRDTELEAKIVERIRYWTGEGLENEEIAERLNHESFIPCRSAAFTAQIVAKLKMRHGIISNLERVRRGEISWAYTLPEIARLTGIDPCWIYRKIGDGTIKIRRDPRYRCYLFPKDKKVIATMKRLRNQEVRHVSIPKVHYDG